MEWNHGSKNRWNGTMEVKPMEWNHGSENRWNETMDKTRWNGTMEVKTDGMEPRKYEPME